MHPVELTDGHVSLRELTSDDFSTIRAYAEDPEVHRYTIWQVDEPEDTRRWLRSVTEQARAIPRTSYQLALCEHGEHVGGAHLGIYSTHHAGVGYVVRRDRWDRGLATAAVRLLCRLAFEELGLHRVIAKVDVDNIASQRVLLKAGFRHEGTQLEAERIADGWRDVHLYAMLAREWR